jgi:hypothetical protein
MILNHLKPIIAEKCLVPTHQFGFRKNYSISYHITDIIDKTFEIKGLGSAVFLDIAQDFDREWHTGNRTREL